MRRIILIAMIVFIFSGVLTSAQTDFSKVSFNDLFIETQRSSEAPGSLAYVTWAPNEIWKVQAEYDPSISEMETTEILRILSPYTVLHVAGGEVNYFGTALFTPRELLMEQVKIVTSDGTQLGPIDLATLGLEVRDMVGFLEGSANEGIAEGEELMVMLFPACADALSEGEFTVIVNDEQFKFETPLSSLLPPKHCPNCEQDMNGKFNFCPHDGTELILAP